MIAPLEGLDLRTRPLATQGGYLYLQATNDGDIHPGDDWNAGDGPNADCGRNVLAVRQSVVRHASWHVTNTGRGFGNHVWLETDSRHFLHYCHLMNLPVREGDVLTAGEAFALCGRTAGWDACHLHFEVRNTPPADWNQWAGKWTRERIAAEYRDPYAWLLEYATGDEMTPEQQQLLDAAASWQIPDAGTLNFMMGTRQTLAEQVASLEQIKTAAQTERDLYMAEVDRLKAQGGAAVDVVSVAVKLTDGREVVR